MTASDPAFVPSETVLLEFPRAGAATGTFHVRLEAIDCLEDASPGTLITLRSGIGRSTSMNREGVLDLMAKGYRETDR